MKNTESAGGVVINSRGEIALVLHGTGQAWWGFPKGHVDDNEEILDAAKREIEEETGIKNLELLRPLGSYQRLKASAKDGDASEYKTIHMFLFSTDQEELKPIDPVHPEAKWVKKDQVAATLSHPKDAEFYLGILPTIA